MAVTEQLKSLVPRFKTSRPKREKFNFTLARSTYERMADAAFAKGESLSAFVEESVLSRIQAEEEKNGPFPHRPKDED